MSNYVDKTQENKSQSVVNPFSQKQISGESTFQFVDNRPEEVAQRKLQEIANNSPQAKQAAQRQSLADNNSAQQQPSSQKKASPKTSRKKNKTGLPDNLKVGIETLSGHSMNDVKVHYNSAKPAQLQAHAYAQGADIHLASGQEKHLPHEAWHVVQQKQGRVNPTLQMKGRVDINDDAGLEREADVMGARALSFGAQMHHGDDSYQSDIPVQQKSLSNTVQCVSVEVSGGHFRTLNGRYYAINEDNSPIGCRKTGARIMLDFIPDNALDAQSISLVQTVNDQTKVTGETQPLREDARLADREIKSGAGKGTAIDQVPYDGDELINLDPRYTENRMSEEEALNQKPPAFPPLPPTPGYSAHKVGDEFTPALLKDEPAITTAMTSSVSGGMDFEVAALAEGGEGGDKFVGSVKWGWKVVDGLSQLVPLSIVSQGAASITFMKAADNWNQQVFEDADSVDHEAMQLPLSKYYLTLKKIPIKQKKKMLRDKLLYNAKYREMLINRTGFAQGSSEENIKKARAAIERTIKSDAAEYIEISAELDQLDTDSETAAF